MRFTTKFTILSRRVGTTNTRIWSPAWYWHYFPRSSNQFDTAKEVIKHGVTQSKSSSYNWNIWDELHMKILLWLMVLENDILTLGYSIALVSGEGNVCRSSISCAQWSIEIPSPACVRNCLNENKLPRTYPQWSEDFSLDPPPRYHEWVQHMLFIQQPLTLIHLLLT